MINKVATNEDWVDDKREFLSRVRPVVQGYTAGVLLRTPTQTETLFTFTAPAQYSVGKLGHQDLWGKLLDSKKPAETESDDSEFADNEQVRPHSLV